MTISVSRVLVVCAVTATALASDVSVLGPASGIYTNVPVVIGGIRMPVDYAAQYFVPTDPVPAPPQTTPVVTIPTTTTTPVPPPAPTSSSGSKTITVAGSFNSTLSGTFNYGMTGLTTNSVALSGGSPFVFSGYSGSIDPGYKLSGATLNLGLLIGNMTTDLRSSSLGSLSSLPQVNGTLSNLLITISTGSFSKSVNATSVTAYDLFANGFGADILAGKPLTITFSGVDSIYGLSAPLMSDPSASPIVVLGGIRMPSDYVQTQMMQSIVLGDTRTIASVNGSTYLKLYETAPQSAAPLADAPEPISTALVGCGLLLLGYIRLRKKA